MARLYSILIFVLISSSVCALQTATWPADRPPTEKFVRTQELPKAPTSARAEQSPAAVPTNSADLADAVRRLRIAREQAKQSGSKSEEAEAALNEARTIELWIAIDPAQVALVSEAIEAYRVAMASGTLQQRSLAANNLGVLLLRHGRTDEALQVFRQVDLNSITLSDVYLYQYNYGRALELNKDSKNAYLHYNEAVKLRPDFLPSVEGAYRVLWELKPASLGDATRLADVLVHGGHADLARNQLKHSLVLWSRESDAPQLLGELVRVYQASAVSPPSFQKEEYPWLSELESSPLKPGVDELSLAYSGRFPNSFEPKSGPFSYWSTGGSDESFGELLKMVGDYYAREENYALALACYSNAWAISKLPESALYTAALIRDRHELDPDGRLLTQLVDSIFVQKGDAYSRQDWPNILRLHTVLGTIFESESRWGSSENPRSAIFQWEHALAAEREVSATHSNVPPSPGLHLHLANCYQKAGNVAGARREYLAAAEAFVKTSEWEPAASAIRTLHSLGDLGTMPPDDARRLNIVERVLEVREVAYQPPFCQFEIKESTCTGQNDLRVGQIFCEHSSKDKLCQDREDTPWDIPFNSRIADATKDKKCKLKLHALTEGQPSSACPSNHVFIPVSVH